MLYCSSSRFDLTMYKSTTSGCFGGVGDGAGKCLLLNFVETAWPSFSSLLFLVPGSSHHVAEL